MHDDTFILSPSREVDACAKTIQKIKKSLGILERKHHKTTAQFIEELEKGTLPLSDDLKDDYDAWKSSYDSLKQWEELKRQYQETYKTRKM